MNNWGPVDACCLNSEFRCPASNGDAYDVATTRSSASAPYNGYRSCCGYKKNSAFLLRPAVWPGACQRIGSGYCRIRISHKALKIEGGAQHGLPSSFNGQPQLRVCDHAVISSC